MTFLRLLLRNLCYHWRGNLAVALGVAVGTAVLTGALLVGDSLRGSLRQQTLERLGWIDEALITGRFFRTELAKALPAVRVSPAIVLQGAATAHPGGDAKQLRRSGGVTVLGIDERFWPKTQVPGDVSFWRSTEPEAVLNTALAQELKVKPGDRVTLHLQKTTAVPRETLLGRRGAEDVLDDLPLTVRLVLPDQGMARFTVNPTPQAPRNAFVPLQLLQAKFDKKDRCNALFAGGATGNLQQALRHGLTLDDWNLVLQTPEDRARHEFKILDPRARNDVLKKARWAGRVPLELATLAKDGNLTLADFIAYYQKHHPYVNLESRQMFLEQAVADAAQQAGKMTLWRAAPTLIYLADSIRHETEEIPYAVVAALNPSEKSPLGPFLPPAITSLRPDEIVLADWKESPLKAKPGDWVTLSYYDPEAAGKLELRSARFQVRGLLPMTGPADDPDLTPEFPGITDKLEIGQWENPPFPYQPRRVKPADEEYWKRYRTTPKAYVNLATGQKLWGSRFGQLTSIRLAHLSETVRGLGAQHWSSTWFVDGKKTVRTPAQFADFVNQFRDFLVHSLPPEAGGFVFRDLSAQGMAASAGGTDFGLLFFGFSLFLIVAALLLVGLLFRLNLDRRASEIGILLATGFRRRRVRWLLLGEGAILALVGAAVGCAGAVLYAWLLLDFLAARWPGGLEHAFLRLHMTTQSFAIGYAAAVLVSALTIFWAMRVLSRIAPTALLAGQTTAAHAAGSRFRLILSIALMGVCFLGAVASVIAGTMAEDHEARAGSFFTSGLLLLIMCLAGVWAWTLGTRHHLIRGHGMPALARLGARNGARNPLRSLLTMGLLACATFLVIAVQSFHREPGQDFLDLNGGSGGFTLLADCDVPLYQDLSAPAGRDQLNLPEKAQKTLNGIDFFSFRVRPGDDASCLNLYQPQRPRLFGVPHALVQRGGFRFSATEAASAEERENPWRLLEKPRADGAIPVFGEGNTVIWQLKKGLGQELIVPNERGEPVRVRIVGLLEDSVFQGELLLSDASFLRLYPQQEGFQFFLIGAPPARMDEVKQTLETALADHGFTVESSARRLGAYLAVENTYLLTFQALGGLGLVLGSLGLAIVLLRSVWERRGELALLRALGYRRGALSWLVLAETLWLLLLGLATGVIAALASTSPYVLGGTGQIAWPWIGGLVFLVFVVGLGAGAVALARTLRAPLLTALRRE